jgi:PAS domain S-box-containing protein
VPDDAVLERTLAFDPALISAREARRFVRGVLEEGGRTEWVDAAELAVSEVVTNVVLHAHTAFTLTVRLTGDHVRVEVRDENPALPQQRSYDDEATTGRGMALVETVTDAHGVQALGGEGKVVWFCVGSAGDDVDPEDLLAAWDDDGWDVTGLDEGLSEADAREAAAAPDPAEEPVVTVRLLRMPPTLWLVTRQHHDALLRELALYRAGHAPSGVSAEDLALADAARTAVGAAVDAAVARVRLGADERLPLPENHPAPLPAVPAQLDLEIAVPASGGRAFAVLGRVLRAAEELARTDALLVLPGLPEVVALGAWAADSVVRQLDGAEPEPWPGADDERFAGLTADGGTPLPTGWDVASVRDAERGAVAADDANRIVAISRPLAELLGHRVDDLVGRRVVTIVPPRFREAHVAGFTRHLTTGEAHVLGVELVLPVLRRDGTEVDCTFVIEQAGTSDGRRVYTAWITPTA